MHPRGEEERPIWHTLPAEAVLALLHSTSAGLASAEAARRLAEYGPNALEPGRKVSPWEVLLGQFKNILILILLVATGLSAALGHVVEAIAITVIVLFAVLLGFVQEYRAERALETLREMAAPTAHVLRDGQEIGIPARELVPGDVVILRTGDRVPADLRLIEAINLQIDEAPLTGESVPVEKYTSPLPDPALPLADRHNMAYAGTTITYGRGRGVVVATGMATEFGQIARMLQTVETGRTPLQENLDRVGHTLARAALVVVALVAALGVVRGEPLIQMFVFGIALAVAVVPEALPAVVTISLAIGVQRMVRRNALIRRLPAVETLGSVSVICSDKTGTLTRNEMTVREIFVAGELWEVSGEGYEPRGRFLRNGHPYDPPEALTLLLRAATLASDAELVQVGGRWQVRGDPTEAALVVAAAKAGLQKQALDAAFPRLHEIPFTSERKRMTTLHRDSQGPVAYSKGAPEVLLASCHSVYTTDGVAPLSEEQREQILDVARRMAQRALRVLAVAFKPNPNPQDPEQDMILLGLVGMMDPPRPEAKAAVQTCEQAGIKPVMITGDHPITAQAIARELGILKDDCMITGPELDQLPDESLAAQADHIRVYSRVSPAHKLRVVTALQRNGHIVAMTGDGVNDAPALKKADIGVAMGITGTDVSKEAADMVLLDDNFASIVAAVEEGRAVFSNIKKYLMYLLSSNVGEILLMAAASLLGLPLPLTAVQILYVNLATDGLPALALSVDPPEPDLMRRPPRDPRASIFTRPVIVLLLVGGMWSALVNLTVFSWALGSGRGLSEAMTMTFVSLVLIQFFKAYNFRSDRHSVLHRPFANRWLNLAILWELLLLSAIVYLPFFHAPFGTFPLTLEDWAIVVVLAFTVSPVLEITKWILRRTAFAGTS
ncbi:MAG: calcium-translocating P-type ATPase, SERCA-type [Armatimonadetes bacterium]|nr:calcium-translocating P-type ATPase, SERCA-type [Armatimonadota bacterium]MDW8154538.1 calcium-translocating P-type ATPase, SERCA-type [Armatimonadota bacterium]